MMTPFPSQLSGAEFLAARSRALLADEPRVGKTGAAIIAADCVLAEKILVITTASGRPVWSRALPQWSSFGRRVQVLDGRKTLDPKTQCAIVAWGALSDPHIRTALLRREWDVVIADESHFAKNFAAVRTQALYGTLDDGGRTLDTAHAVAAAQDYIWPMSGTPVPNSPADLYPMLRALRPECLEAHDGMPDVMREQDFLKRYCIVRAKKISNFRRIPVIMGGRDENLPELKARLGDFILRRTQKDVGIREPIYEIFPLTVSDRVRRIVDGDLDRKSILEAAGAGDTRALKMQLGPLRRMTGEIKARAVVEYIKDEFDCGLDKVMLAYQHRAVGAILEQGLAAYGVVKIDGSTLPAQRETAEQSFLHEERPRVLLGQLQAAAEAIDASASALLVFVETSFIPKEMSQMSKRITNYTQERQPIVRVAVLDGSIDEASEKVLLRKWSSIRAVTS